MAYVNAMDAANNIDEWSRVLVELRRGAAAAPIALTSPDSTNVDVLRRKALEWLDNPYVTTEHIAALLADLSAAQALMRDAFLPSCAPPQPHQRVQFVPCIDEEIPTLAELYEEFHVEEEERLRV
jgi:hypothetical protein